MTLRTSVKEVTAEQKAAVEAGGSRLMNLHGIGTAGGGSTTSSTSPASCNSATPKAAATTGVSSPDGKARMEAMRCLRRRLSDAV
jgi:hypothetical protein